jgi:hypothetical protein
MPDDEPSAGRDENADALELTELRPRGDTPAWRRRILGPGLFLLVAVLLVAVLAGGPLAGAPIALTPTPPATATIVPLLPTETVSAALPPAPAPPLAAPTALPGLSGMSGMPVLAPAPARCGGEPPALTAGGPPHWGQAIGRAPVLLGGFIGPYATMPLGPAASAMAYGWTAPYTPFGWPAPIGLVLRAGFGGGSVTLSGWDPRTGYPLWFGFITAREWGAPQHVVPAFTLDPAHPSVPAGGWTAGETFWYGYAFLPGAGCYTLAAAWPGGGWQVTISAGAIGDRR